MLSAWAKVQWQEEAHMQRRHALTLLGATAGGLALTAALPAAACGLFPQASGLFSQASGWRFLVLRHGRSEEHTSELQSLMRNSYAVFFLKKKIITTTTHTHSESRH